MAKKKQLKGSKASHYWYNQAWTEEVSFTCKQNLAFLQWVNDA